MAQDMLFSGESKNIEYKVTVPDKSGDNFMIPIKTLLEGHKVERDRIEYKEGFNLPCSIIF